jgi:Tol biopolymer transport system component
VVANPRIDETYAFGGSGYVGWSQDSVRDLNHYDLYLRTPDGRTVKVNPAGTQAFGGGIDGNTMVYEQFTKRNDDLWIVDLTTMAQTRLAPTVTSSPEWEPTISGDWILFARTTSRSTLVLLYNRATGEVRQLASLTAAHQYVYPGQVNGNYAVWGKTTRRSQQVYLYDIAARRSTRLAQPSGRYQYDPAVTASGTVYFVRSRNGCGESVVIYKQPLGGSAQPIQRLRSGTDVNFTLYASTTNGQTQVLYSRLSCRTKLGDVYALTG